MQKFNVIAYGVRFMSVSRPNAPVDPRVPDPQEIEYRGIEAEHFWDARDKIEQVLLDEDMMCEVLRIRLAD